MARSATWTQLLGHALCAVVWGTVWTSPSAAVPFEDKSTELIEYGKLKAGHARDQLDQITGTLQQNLRLNGLALHASSSGLGASVPLHFSIGISDGWSLQVRPVIGATLGLRSQRPMSGSAGMNVEFYRLLRREGRFAPALTCAASSNVLTGRQDRWGSGKGKYDGRLVATKQMGRLGLFANTSYSFSTHFSGSQMDKIFQSLNLSGGGQYLTQGRFEVLAQVDGKHTSKRTRLRSEVYPRQQQEVVVAGTLRGGAYVRKNVIAYLGLGYDTRGTIRFSPGIGAQF